MSIITDIETAGKKVGEFFETIATGASDLLALYKALSGPPPSHSLPCPLSLPHIHLSITHCLDSLSLSLSLSANPALPLPPYPLDLTLP